MYPASEPALRLDRVRAGQRPDDIARGYSFGHIESDNRGHQPAPLPRLVALAIAG